MGKNRFYYSFSQDCIAQRFGEVDDNFCPIEGVRENYVLTPNGWKRYTEWCSQENSRCNWEDAELVLETDDKPKIKIEYRKTSILQAKDQQIADLEAKLAEKEKELQYKTAECEKWQRDYKNCSELEKIMTKEHQYCLDNWRASEQDKISFCIEQLEKAKKIVNKNDKNGYLIRFANLDERLKFYKEIDQLIAEIKGREVV